MKKGIQEDCKISCLTLACYLWKSSLNRTGIKGKYKLAYLQCGIIFQKFWNEINQDKTGLSAFDMCPSKFKLIISDVVLYLEGCYLGLKINSIIHIC